MKTLVKIFAATLFVFTVSMSYAQTEETTCDPVLNQNLDGSGAKNMGAMKGQGRANLSEEQQLIIAQNQAANAESREAFKATLTEEQLAIISNMELTREEKQEALKATFSEAQLALYDAHQALVADQRKQMKGSMSESQMNAAKQNGWKRQGSRN